MGEDYGRISEEIKAEEEIEKEETEPIPTAAEGRAEKRRDEYFNRLSHIMQTTDRGQQLEDSDYNFLMRQRPVIDYSDESSVAFAKDIKEYQATAREIRSGETLLSEPMRKLKESVIEIGGEPDRGEVEAPEPVRKLTGAEKEKLPYEWGGMKVYLVNGNYIRKTTDPKFVGGISNFTNPNIPADEIWIENTGDDATNKKATLRQFLEMKYQGAGLELDEARRKSFEKIATYPDEASITLGLWEMSQVEAPPKRPKPISESISETPEKGRLDIDDLLLGMGEPKQSSVEEETEEEDTVLIPAHRRKKPNGKEWYDDKNYLTPAPSRRVERSRRRKGHTLSDHLLPPDLGASI